MFAHLLLDRPLAVLDLETTGTEPATDRIVEIGVLTRFPDGTETRFVERVDPTVPIPPAATAIHGISDADVAGCRTFANLAPNLLHLLRGRDLGGFGIKRFDLPLLCAEFARMGAEFPLHGRRVIDALEIYHAREPRNLAAAVRLYCGHEHDGAHGALADVAATAEVLDGMLARYGDLPRTAEALAEAFTDPNAVDAIGGKFVRDAEGVVRLAFGKHKGKSLDQVRSQHSDYLRWILGGDFLPDTKEIARMALQEKEAPHV